jgi:hypothetical protein
MTNEFLAQGPILSGFLHLSFLGVVHGERPNVTENSFLLSGLSSLPTEIYLLHLIYVYVMLTDMSNFSVLLTCGADNSVMICTSQYSSVVQYFILVFVLKNMYFVNIYCSKGFEY